MNKATYVVQRQSEHLVSQWAGGSTTQLAIYPPQAVYAERNFQWRISTATVAPGSSTFTALPSYTRHLLVLEGEMRLVHAGQRQATLHPGQQDFFHGSWETRCTCIGQGRDFNLMLAPGWEGRLWVVSVQQKMTVALPSLAGGGQAEAFYCVAGRVQCVGAAWQETLAAGDFLLVLEGGSQEMKINNLDPSIVAQLVHASVSRTC